MNKKITIEEVINQIKNLKYKVEDKAFCAIDDEGRKQIGRRLEDFESRLSCAIGTGVEKSNVLIMEIMDFLRSVGINMNKGLVSAVFSYLDRIEVKIKELKAVMAGKIVLEEDDYLSKKEFKTRNRILALEKQMAEFSKNEAMIRAEIRNCENAIEELNNQIMKEDNTSPLLVDYFREIKLIEMQEEQMEVRSSNCGLCRSILGGLIHHLKDSFRFRNLSECQLTKINGIIDSYLKESVLDNPEKALGALNHFKSELADIAQKTESIENRLFESNIDHATQVNKALEYKMQLMNKKIEKEKLQRMNLQLLTAVK